MNPEIEPSLATKINKFPITHILLIIALGLIFLACAYILSLQASHSAILAEKETIISDLLQTNEKTQQANTKLNADVDSLRAKTCKGKWTIEGGCQNDLALNIVGITSGKSCFGDTLKISWDPGSSPIDTMDILLTTPQTTLRLDTVRSSAGLYEWKINSTHITTSGNGGSAEIQAGDVYKIRLQSGGQPVENGESELFSISSCVW
jgi:hypothetical protein